MKHRAYLLFALSLLSWSTPGHAQNSAGFSGSSVTGVPWAGDRALGEGQGIKTGSVEWHPGASAEMGFDSNYLQRSGTTEDEENFGPVVPSLRLRVTPQLTLRTLDTTREGSESALPPAFMFALTGAASYSEFFPFGDDSDANAEFRRLRNLSGGAGLDLDFFARRKWSGRAMGSYGYQAEPSNQGGLGAQFDRHTVGAGADLTWAPGGGSFRWNLLEYRTRATFFDDGEFGVYDNGNHSLGTSGFWRFLPKTSVLYDAQYGIIRYGSTALNDGEYMVGRMGLNGLLTKKLSLLAMGGWAASFYRDQIGLVRNYDGFVGKAEARWFITADGRLHDGSANVGASAVALGGVRDYNQSYLGDFFRRDRLYAQMSYLIAGRVVTTAEGGISRITYPDFLYGNVVQQGFGETRFDVKGFIEYRPLSTVGINLQLLYDQNVSRVIEGQNPTGGTFEDDLSFSRFRALLGARWFM
jgi:hypothetical protein